MRLLSWALLLAGIICIAQQDRVSAYWQSRDSNYNINVTSSGGAYTGPGDVVSGAYAAWSFRAYNAAYATALGKIANICTPSDASCADVHSDTSGNFNLAGSGLTCNNSTSICTVKTLYDQSGNTNCTSSVACDVTNATISNRPVLLQNAVNGKWCMQLTSSSKQSLRSSTASGLAQAFTVSAVYEFIDNAAQSALFGDSSNIEVGNHRSTANDAFIYAGSAVPTATANASAFHAAQYVFNNASSDLYIDGSTNPGSLGSSTGIAVQNLSVGSQGGIGAGVVDPYNGVGCEVLVYPVGFSSGQKASMNSNQSAYY